MQRLYRPGSFLRIPLSNGSFAYGRVLKLPHNAYYAYPDQSAQFEHINAMAINFQQRN